jgi:hypothetical protein
MRLNNSNKRPRLSPALIISTAALFVALGGTGYAAFSLPKNSVGTKQLKNGAVISSKIKNGAITAGKINTNRLTVPYANTAGRAGSASTANNAGDASTLGGSPPSAFEHASSILTAVVTDDGTTATVVRGSPGVTATRDGAGIVLVHMGRDVSKCTWIATQGNPGSTFVPGYFAVVRGDSNVPNGSVNDVDVGIYNTSGFQVDANFHLLVIC